MSIQSMQDMNCEDFYVQSMHSLKWQIQFGVGLLRTSAFLVKKSTIYCMYNPVSLRVIIMARFTSVFENSYLIL